MAFSLFEDIRFGIRQTNDICHRTTTI